jgi:hypothetical protein
VQPSRPPAGAHPFRLIPVVANTSYITDEPYVGSSYPVRFVQYRERQYWPSLPPALSSFAVSA